MHIDPQEIADYPESYACMCLSMKDAGHDVNYQLPGRDRPETVERLYKELNEWLNA